MTVRGGIDRDITPLTRRISGAHLLTLSLAVLRFSIQALATGWDLEGMNFSRTGCNVQRFDVSELSQAIFDAHFRRGFMTAVKERPKCKDNEPVVLTGLTGNRDFRAACHRDALMEAWGDKEVVLSTANTYSYDKVKMSLRDYILKHMGYQPPSTSGKDTLYHFGDNNHTEWQELFGQYSVPPLVPPDASVALSFGLGGPGSGVPFHIHGPGWSETVIGRKLWLLYPPDERPPFDPDERSVVWAERWEQGKLKFQEPLTCVLEYGQVIYFPSGWWHSTVNLDQSVFVSSFVMYAAAPASSSGEKARSGDGRGGAGAAAASSSHGPSSSAAGGGEDEDSERSAGSELR